MVEILKVKGGNNYKSPHTGKKKLDRLGQLPNIITMPIQLVDDTFKYLNEGISILRNTMSEQGSTSRQDQMVLVQVVLLEQNEEYMLQR